MKAEKRLGLGSSSQEACEMYSDVGDEVGAKGYIITNTDQQPVFDLSWTSLHTLPHTFILYRRGDFEQRT